jgi:hypothetical protein
VEQLAGQIRDAVEAGQVWRPDYQYFMAATGRRRSWCEKVIRDARNLILTPPPGTGDDSDSQSRTDGEGPRLRRIRTGGDAPDPGNGKEEPPLADAS